MASGYDSIRESVDSHWPRVDLAWSVAAIDHGGGRSSTILSSYGGGASILILSVSIFGIEFLENWRVDFVGACHVLKGGAVVDEGDEEEEA